VKLIVEIRELQASRGQTMELMRSQTTAPERGNVLESAIRDETPRSSMAMYEPMLRMKIPNESLGKVKDLVMA